RFTGRLEQSVTLVLRDRTPDDDEGGIEGIDRTDHGSREGLARSLQQSLAGGIGDKLAVGDVAGIEPSLLRACAFYEEWRLAGVPFDDGLRGARERPAGTDGLHVAA